MKDLPLAVKIFVGEFGGLRSGHVLDFVYHGSSDVRGEAAHHHLLPNVVQAYVACTFRDDGEVLRRAAAVALDAVEDSLDLLLFAPSVFVREECDEFAPSRVRGIAV